MKTAKTQTLIAMVDTLQPLRPSDFNAPEIRVTIARLNPEDNKPRNWSLDYQEPKNSTGGCFGRAFCSSYKPEVYFSWFGPEITYGDLNQYNHASRALKTIGARLDKISATRGASADAAECFGRWLEACGIEKVFVREPDCRATWLNEIDWQQWSIGRFVHEVRALYPKTEATAEAVAS